MGSDLRDLVTKGQSIIRDVHLSPNLRSAGVLGALSPPSLQGLTALVGIAVLGRALVQGLLLSEMILVGFAVPAGTGTDPPLEGSSPQDLAAGEQSPQ